MTCASADNNESISLTGLPGPFWLLWETWEEVQIHGYMVVVRTQFSMTKLGRPDWLLDFSSRQGLLDYTGAARAALSSTPCAFKSVRKLILLSFFLFK